MKPSTKKILYLSFFTSKKIYDNYVLDDENNYFQTFRFAQNIMGVLKKTNLRIHTYSFLPISVYPFNRKFLVKRVNEFIGADKVVYLGFLNLSIIRLFSRFFRLYFQSIIDLRLLKKVSLVFVHGIHLPYLLYVCVNSYIFNFKSVVFLTDPAGMITDYDSSLVSALKKTEKYIITFLLKRFTTYVVLSESLIKYYNLNPKECLTLPGFYNIDSSISASQYIVNSKFIIVYSGSISVDYGLPFLNELGLLLKNDNCIIKVMGKFSEEHLKNFPEVVFTGFLIDNEYDRIMNEAHLFINPRDPSLDFSNLSFPSKIFEYVRYLTPIISTDLESFTPQLRDHITICQTMNPLDFYKGIISIRKNYEYYSEKSTELSNIFHQEYSLNKISEKILKKLI